MNALQEDIEILYNNSLDQLIENLENTPEEFLWSAPEGVANNCGVLAQHLIGNLNHYIGCGIGDTGYVRRRDQEFRTTKRSKEELIQATKELKKTLGKIFRTMDGDELIEDFPLEIPVKTTKRGVLIHLYGHLNYHLGQLNYLRRIRADQ